LINLFLGWKAMGLTLERRQKLRRQDDKEARVLEFHR